MKAIRVTDDWTGDEFEFASIDEMKGFRESFDSSVVSDYDKLVSLYQQYLAIKDEMEQIEAMLSISIDK